MADGDTIRRVAGAHADPELQRMVDDLSLRFPPDPNGPHPAVQALRTGESAFVAEVPREPTGEPDLSVVGRRASGLRVTTISTSAGTTASSARA